MLKGIGLIALSLAIEGAFLLQVALPSRVPEQAADAAAAAVVHAVVPAVNAEVATQPPAESERAQRMEPCKPSS